MTHRERFFQILEGKRPKNIPFIPDITDWYNGNHTPKGCAMKHGAGCYIPDNDDIRNFDGTIPEKYKKWSLMDFYRNFDWCFHGHIYDWYDTNYSGGIEEVRVDSKGEYDIELRFPNGKKLTRKYKLAVDGSWCPTEHFAKNENELKLLMKAISAQSYVPKHDYVKSIIDEIGGQGQVDIELARSPFGKLIHEYFGLENTVYALMDYPDVIDEFLKLQEQKDLEIVQLACKDPARLICLADHADETLISPAWYKKYCIPYYKKVSDILHKHKKMISTHLDGNFKGFFNILGETGFDLLDGCTPAPMFNYEPEELAAAMPDDMYAFIGVPATLFCQNVPTKEIFKMADRIMTAFEGRGFINVGDILPPNGDIEQVIELGNYVKSIYNK